MKGWNGNKAAHGYRLNESKEALYVYVRRTVGGLLWYIRHFLVRLGFFCLFALCAKIKVYRRRQERFRAR